MTGRMRLHICLLEGASITGTIRPDAAMSRAMLRARHDYEIAHASIARNHDLYQYRGRMPERREFPSSRSIEFL